MLAHVISFQSSSMYYIYGQTFAVLQFLSLPQKFSREFLALGNYTKICLTYTKI